MHHIWQNYSLFFMMKKFDVDKLIFKAFGSKTGRFNYFLSLLIIVVGFYYFFEYYDPNTCHVCHPIMSFPWKDLIGLLVIIALGGFYSCFLFCMMATDEGYCYGPIIIPILFTLFYVIQTRKRCHDVGESGWRFLLPIYSPLLILFLSPEIEVDEEPEKSSFLMVLWKSKWLILILVLMVAYIYCENLVHIRMHNAL